jgi:hypothetical protein
MSFRRIISMRNLLLAGTAGLFLSLGAATAYAVPQNSPYATMVPPDAVDGYIPPPVYVVPADGAVMVDGRSAYVEGTPVYAPAQPTYVERPVYVERRAYAPFPFSVLPWNW